MKGLGYPSPPVRLYTYPESGEENGLPDQIELTRHTKQVPEGFESDWDRALTLLDSFGSERGWDSRNESHQEALLKAIAAEMVGSKPTELLFNQRDGTITTRSVSDRSEALYEWPKHRPGTPGLVSVRLSTVGRLTFAQVFDSYLKGKKLRIDDLSVQDSQDSLRRTVSIKIKPMQTQGEGEATMTAGHAEDLNAFAGLLSYAPDDSRVHSGLRLATETASIDVAACLRFKRDRVLHTENDELIPTTLERVVPFLQLVLTTDPNEEVMEILNQSGGSQE
ncbi:hypothetical protein BD324DRAFT_649925 [Kockovaella imperatae]|uniref:Uncharacterized protein n=1 Tax=Kockovaella imperatae TaxID=4999 RepID=A0A1Y1UKI6_9TREE|nr:hypothetical protein BD324DRAFT_649925 [Kockovaella imperatae]ORX38563.1 hypothetical protein BD324DRAFT_649925 [Kockovaella imperatae]